jgi:hypothetical protein
MKKTKTVYNYGTRQKKYRHYIKPGDCVRIVGHGVVFVTAVIVKVPIISLCFTDVWLERVEKVWLIYDGINTNTGGYFTPGPTNPTLPIYEAACQEFTKAQENVAKEVPGAVEIRDAKWKIVLKLSARLRDYVGYLATDDPDNAAEMAREAHLAYSVRQGRGKNICKAASSNPGEVETTGRTKKGRVSTDWQICLDPTVEANWLLIKVPPTSAVKTTIKGLLSKKDYYVRSCSITKDGPDAWEPPIKIETK